MSLLGSAGIGLVWGWLLWLVGGHGLQKRPWREAMILLLATGVVGVLFPLFADWRDLFVFLGTAVFAFILHMAWLHSLHS